ncbi:MAG: saccharopine dehydrogenase family protein [Candidatus Helarchaeota archaeon]
MKSLKILALGGAGDMGRMAVTTLLSSSKITSITIADKNIKLARRFIELSNSNKLTAVEVDVTEQNKLIDLILEHDLVINTVGPFFKFGKPILEAVIKAKKDYVDICDDWKPTLEMLKMNEAAKEAGITAILGIGASPGILNLLTVLACSELDDIDEVITGWGIGSVKSGDKPRGFVRKKKLMKTFKKENKQANAAILHLLHECIGKIPVFRDGKLIEIDALSEAPPIKFPGIKDFYAVNVGHPEPVTLSRTIKAKSISNVMYLTRTLTNKLREYVRKIENKELTVTEAAILIDKELNKLSSILILLWELLKRFFKVPPELCVTVTGLKGGRRKKVAIGIKYRPWGEIDEGMDGLTAVPMAIAAIMIIEGRIQVKGVLTPEESIDPKEFFEIYAKFCKKNLTAKEVLIKKELWL